MGLEQLLHYERWRVPIQCAGFPAKNYKNKISHRILNSLLTHRWEFFHKLTSEQQSAPCLCLVWGFIKELERSFSADFFPTSPQFQTDWHSAELQRVKLVLKQKHCKWKPGFLASPIPFQLLLATDASYSICKQQQVSWDSEYFGFCVFIWVLIQKLPEVVVTWDLLSEKGELGSNTVWVWNNPSVTFGAMSWGVEALV